jgi:hypothetical protein
MLESKQRYRKMYGVLWLLCLPYGSSIPKIRRNGAINLWHVVVDVIVVKHQSPKGKKRSMVHGNGGVNKKQKHIHTHTHTHMHNTPQYGMNHTRE